MVKKLVIWSGLGVHECAVSLCIMARGGAKIYVMAC